MFDHLNHNVQLRLVLSSWIFVLCSILWLGINSIILREIKKGHKIERFAYKTSKGDSTELYTLTKIFMQVSENIFCFYCQIINNILHKNYISIKKKGIFKKACQVLHIYKKVIFYKHFF